MVVYKFTSTLPLDPQGSRSFPPVSASAKSWPDLVLEFLCPNVSLVTPLLSWQGQDAATQAYQPPNALVIILKGELALGYVCGVPRTCRNLNRGAVVFILKLFTFISRAPT